MYDWLWFSGKQQEQNIGIVGYEVYSKISVLNNRRTQGNWTTATIGRARDGDNDIQPES